MGRGHLQTARTELDVYITVLDDGNDAVHQRYDDLVALEPLVLRVLGVDTHGGITHDGLWTGGGHDGVVTLGVFVDDITFCLQGFFIIESLQIGHVVFQVEQMALLLFIDHFLGREGGEGLRIPVHHAQATVDEAFVIEVNKHFDHTFTARFVHREGCTVPVAAGTQTAQLFQDDATMLVGPVPGMLKELLTGQVTLLDTLGSELLDYLRLSGNRGMVGTRHPTGILTFHTGTAYQNILNGVIEHVSHVEHTRHIGWWDDYRIGFASIGFAGKKFVIKPVLIPFRLIIFKNRCKIT